MPFLSGFDFIDIFQKIELNKKHGKILLLSAFFSPIEIKKAKEMGIKCIDKPLTLEKLFT